MADRLLLFFGIVFLLLLSGCSVEPVKPGIEYSGQDREELYRLDNWKFEGRVAVSSPNDSWSADVTWRRQADLEIVRLAGPLGQGGAVVKIAEDSITVDQGEGELFYSDDAANEVTKQLGFHVPLQSLKYWVVGLPDPNESHVQTPSGFIQNDSTVDYKQMQQTQLGLLPQKIYVQNRQVKLKLIIDQWNSND